MKRRSRPKLFPEMNRAELAGATREFDTEFVADTFGPPNESARRQWQRARRKRGRPAKGRGAKAISITVERSLLARVDRLTKKLRVTRSAIIQRGLIKVIAEQRRRKSG